MAKPATTRGRGLQAHMVPRRIGVGTVGDILRRGQIPRIETLSGR